MGIVLFFFLLWIGCAALVGSYAKNKGRSGGWFFFWTLILGPLIVGIIAVLAHDRPRPATVAASPAPRPVAAAPAGWLPPVGQVRNSRLEDLKELAELHDRGALTDAEFDAEKARILGASAQTPSRLRS